MRRLLSLMFHDVYRNNPSESGFNGPAADRYKLELSEFDAQLQQLAMALSERPVLVSESSPQELESVGVTITVDDGGVSYLSLIADRLEELGWRGHCLVTSNLIGQSGFLEAKHLRELQSRGHCIGTHSVSHPERFSSCTLEQMIREWSESRKVLQDILGNDVTVGSVPGGYYSRRIALAAHAAGLKILFTSEPTTRVQSVYKCDVVGRFAFRAGCPPNYARDLANLRSSLLIKEWITWNSKKVLKQILGPGYSRLASWVTKSSS